MLHPYKSFVFHTVTFYSEVSPLPWKTLYMQEKETWFMFFEVIIWRGKKINVEEIFVE